MLEVSLGVEVSKVEATAATSVSCSRFVGGNCFVFDSSAKACAPLCHGPTFFVFVLHQHTAGNSRFGENYHSAGHTRTSTYFAVDELSGESRYRLALGKVRGSAVVRV